MKEKSRSFLNLFVAVGFTVFFMGYAFFSEEDLQGLGVIPKILSYSGIQLAMAGLGPLLLIVFGRENFKTYGLRKLNFRL